MKNSKEKSVLLKLSKEFLDRWVEEARVKSKNMCTFSIIFDTLALGQFLYDIFSKNSIFLYSATFALILGIGFYLLSVWWASIYKQRKQLRDEEFRRRSEPVVINSSKTDFLINYGQKLIKNPIP